MLNKTFDEKYAQYYDLFNTGKDYKKECDFLEEIFKKYSLKPVKNILDLGCGTGRHDLYLSERGYNIDGLDISSEMIKIAILNKRDNMQFYVGDMSNFSIGKKYDICISFFSSFGYLTKNKQIESALRCINNHLNSGGLFILDCWNGMGVLGDPPIQRIKEKDVNNLRIIRKSFPKLNTFNNTCEVKFEVSIFIGDELVDNFFEIHNVRYFFPLEIKEYFKSSELKLLGIHPQLDINSNVSEKDWNMWAIGRVK